MADRTPGYSTLKETLEAQLWASGPDNQHKRYDTKAIIKSSVTDSANSPTSTLRAGMIMGLKDSDSKSYKYDATATDGTQKVAGVLPYSLSMLDPDGVAEDKFSRLMTQGILKNPSVDLLNYDLMSMAVLLRSGYTTAALEPHGSAFLTHPKARYFKTGDYTVLTTDNGYLFVAATNAVNFTLPTLAAGIVGFTAWFFASSNANMVITAAADTIIYDDTTNGKATTLTFSTGSQKMGASVMMRADYDAAGNLSWYPFGIQRTVVAA